MFLRFANIDLLYFFIPIFIALVIYRWRFYKSPVYSFPLAKTLDNQNLTSKNYSKKILFFCRLLSLTGLLFLMLQPQWVDEHSRVNVDGIDIVIALDVSGSMQIFDDLKDQRQRIEVAKTEAIRFIEKRTNDPIGIVLFAKEAISRCPLTLDKKILKEIVGSIELGMIDHNGTWLGTGLAIAINRLRTSLAKSKVIILLTDGQPTPDDKIDPNFAISLAQKFGVKIYTIAIGNENGGFFHHPYAGIAQAPDGVNPALLKTIAEKTGGVFFRANNPKEMALIYDKINKLETTEHQTNIFHKYYEAFLSFIWLVLSIVGIELILKFFVWRGV